LCVLKAYFYRILLLVFILNLFSLIVFFILPLQYFNYFYRLFVLLFVCISYK